MRTWLARHLQVLIATLGDMLRTPLVSVSTILLIGLSLSLPALLYIAIKSGQQLDQSWRGQQQISIFLEKEVSSREASLIFDELRLHPNIELAEMINPDQALAEFKSLSGLTEELQFLDENPLPTSIVVLPAEARQDPIALRQLRDQLMKIDGIEDIRLDLGWAERLSAILNTVRRAALLLSVILGVALSLVVGNSIKLLIMNRRQEIEITKLVGGSNNFVRRPFLYYGLWYGVFGGLTALLVLFGAARYLADHSRHLAQLYQQQSLVYALQWWEAGLLVLIGATLGWVSARLSLAQHLHAIRPR